MRHIPKPVGAHHETLAPSIAARLLPQFFLCPLDFRLDGGAGVRFVPHVSADGPAGIEEDALDDGGRDAECEQLADHGKPCFASRLVGLARPLRVKAQREIGGLDQLAQLDGPLILAPQRLDVGEVVEMRRLLALPA